MRFMFSHSKHPAAIRDIGPVSFISLHDTIAYASFIALSKGQNLTER